MKQYGGYDEEVGAEIFRPTGGMVENVDHPKAYLASYYKFRVEKGSAVEVYFYGTSIEYKCIQGNDMGIVDIEVDGKSRGQFDLYNENDTFDVTGFLDDDLEKGFHVLRIIATGRKNPASAGKAFTFRSESELTCRILPVLYPASRRGQCRW